MSGSCHRILLTIVLLFAATAFAKPPEPLHRIPLEPFGFQAVSARYLLEGATMLTVDYVDNQHLLVTFGVSKLMPRLPDCPEDDQDRTVHAVLLELPSGRELAHTEWRFHDLGQYLWDLGGGHFLLRQRNVLTTFAPLQNLSAAQPFLQQPFLHFDHRIATIVVSATHDLLSVETIRTPPKAEPAPTPQPASTPSPGLKRRDPDTPKSDPAPIEIAFLRLLHQDATSQSDASIVGDRIPAPNTPGTTRVLASLEGRIRTAKPVKLPITSDGILEVKAESHDGVLLNFVTFGGKITDLGDFATSCPIRPTFVSPSEFVTFGCHGSDDAVELAGFNLHGDFLWQTNFPDSQAYPSIVSAVPAGRFALSRTTTLTNVFGSETPSASQLTGQEVRVIQTYNGKQLLRVTTSPIQRAGQNFTLSPDGQSLAVLHTLTTTHGSDITRSTAVEIYALPALSGKDQSELKAEAALAPAPTTARMRFSADEIKGEIKSALATQPAEADTAVTQHQEPASDSGQASTVPPATNAATGSVPASDAAPACATLTDTSGPKACLAPAKSKAADAVEDSDRDQPRRKPPTLYEPASPLPAPPPQ